MVKPEKFGHLHLVYHFTVPLRLGVIGRFSNAIIVGDKSLCT